jgi:glucokinase
VPDSDRLIEYDPLQRLGVGMSRLGTSEAVALGAYGYALSKLG